MRYGEVVRGKFISRPNRFIAKVEIDSDEVTVHVKNTGRCRELLLPGAVVYLEKAKNPERKTPYDLIAVESRGWLINIDSQAPNAAVEEYLRITRPNALIRREVTYGNSRFDFYIEEGNRKSFLEVKGVTLVDGTTAMFPDAPTERGAKHLKELQKCLQDGYEAEALFVVQLKGPTVMTPNVERDPDFSQELKNAYAAGVKVTAVDCIVKPDEMIIDDEINVDL